MFGPSGFQCSSHDIKVRNMRGEHCDYFCRLDRVTTVV